MYVYILELEEGKYYVGITKNIDARMRDHRQGKGSLWTQKYKPLENKNPVLILTDDPFDEDKYVKKTMEAHGIDNVRGGAYSRLILSNEEKYFIERELVNCSGRCFKCYKIGHFAKDCDTQENITVRIRRTVDGNSTQVCSTQVRDSRIGITQTYDTAVDRNNTQVRNTNDDRCVIQ